MAEGKIGRIGHLYGSRSPKYCGRGLYRSMGFTETGLEENGMLEMKFFPDET